MHNTLSCSSVWISSAASIQRPSWEIKCHSTRGQTLHLIRALLEHRAYKNRNPICDKFRHIQRKREQAQHTSESFHVHSQIDEQHKCNIMIHHTGNSLVLSHKILNIHTCCTCTSPLHTCNTHTDLFLTSSSKRAFVNISPI